MWASPRCLSTVLLRSWGSREDTFVHDEPLYPHYLLVSNRPDPGREEILKQYETDWQKIVERVTTGNIPDGKSIYYQKFMVYRLMPHVKTDWINRLNNCFLIRNPHEMLLSYLRLWPNPTMEKIGLQRMKQLFDQICEQRSSIPPVIDAGDLRQNPRRTLSLLCQALDVEFTDAMLHWHPGNPTNDLWSQYGWYDTARNSTTFRPHQLTSETPPDEFRPLLEQCQRIYDELYPYRLTAS